MASKKIKKVETPIDRRETFVSIQKNFAEDGNAQEKLKTLYDLQQADTAIDKIVQLRGELPAEVSALEDELEQMNAKCAQINSFIEGMTLAKYQKQLENITNSREYDSLAKEIENQELLRQIAEKNIGEAKVKIGEAKSDIESVKDMISIRTSDLDAKKEELSHIVESTAKEEEKLQAVRKACAAKIDSRTMSAYERIRESVRNHLAVVTVYNDNACGGCFNTIIPQRLLDIESNRKLIICEHCGRIIVNPDFTQKQ